MKKLFVVLHPFLLAIAPIFFLFSHNLGEASLSQVVFPALMALGITLIILLPLGFLLKNFGKAGCIVSLLWVCFFSYGHVYEATQQLQIGGLFVGRHRFLLPIWGMFFFGGAYFFAVSSRNFLRLAKSLNFAVASFLLISLSQFALDALRSNSDGQGVVETQKSVEYHSQKKNLGKRDVYYIILDGYTSSDVLKKVYRFDNKEFMGFLQGHDFHVGLSEYSNYAQTPLSLSSSLNMKYINYLKEHVGVDSLDRRATYQMIQRAEAFSFLKAQGYKVVNFDSGWGATSYLQQADLNVRCGGGNEFLTELVRTTLLNPLMSHLFEDDVRSRLLCTFSKLAEIGKIEGPKFVFAHIIAPHPPYVFGQNGEVTSQAQISMDGDVWKNKDGYVQQLVFVNKKIEAAVSAILSTSKQTPIIVLQGDHGSASTFYESSNPNGDWEKPTDSNLRERMGILNAYLLPDGGANALYEGITPVNSFRAIFNFYFGTDYEFLEDSSYYSSYEKPYDFVDVTPIVRSQVQ